MLVGIRLRQGKSADVRGAARFLAEALATVRQIAPSATIVVRGDAKFYTADVAATAARYGAAVSLTTGSNPSVQRRDQHRSPTLRGRRSTTRTRSWTPTPGSWSPTPRSPKPLHRVRVPAEAREQMPGRLIVRRVKRLNPPPPPGRTSCSPPGATTPCSSPRRFQMLQAEGQHRDHAIVEQAIADAAASALAHLPSGSFSANAAWAVLWAIAHNLTRAAGVLASGSTPGPPPPRSAPT